MTLDRPGETPAAILDSLRAEHAREERERLVPIVAGEGDARTRLTRALEAVCAITDKRADFLVRVDAGVRNFVYHEPGDEALSRPEFVEPIVRLLRDGALDGSLRSFADEEEVATVLYNQVFWTYLHLRREHRWSAERATRGVIDLAIGGVRP